MIRKTNSGKYHVQVESNGVIGHAIKATPEAAFMAAAVERHHTDRAFTRFVGGLNRNASMLPIFAEA